MRAIGELSVGIAENLVIHTPHDARVGDPGFG